MLIGLDIGTTSARALAIDLDGHVLATATEEYPLETPRPGWTEQDPERWWAASQAVLHRVASQLASPPIALGLTGQIHGDVHLDNSGTDVGPTLPRKDQR